MREHDHVLAALLDLGMHVTLTGDPGTGKTSAPQQYAHARGLACEIVSCSDGATEGQLIARTGVRDGATHLERGPIARRAARGGVLVLDEVGAAPAGVLAALHAGLANGRLAHPLVNDTWRPLTVLTSNAIGSERADAHHEGAVSAALIDRCAVLQVRHSTGAALLAELLALAGVEPPPASTAPALKPREASATRDTVAQVAKILEALRAAEAAGDLPGPHSHRTGTRLLRLLMAWGGSKEGTAWAYRAAYLDRLAGPARAIACEIGQRVLDVRA
jgi:MoxR-like ATPase